MEGGAAQELLREVGRAFALPGAFRGATRHGSGHIHDTFVAVYEGGGAPLRYVHQRLNTAIFRDPEGLMRNTLRVTEHLRAGLDARGVADRERRHLTVLPARDGRPFHVDADGGWWRTTRYLEGTRSVDTLESTAQAREVARAFGEFAALLVDLGPPRLIDTIPDFHHLGKRFDALEAAAGADVCGRVAGVAAELDAARRLHGALDRELAGRAALPRRVVHNDCKVNNVLLDAQTGEALCVVDLDTVMEGTLLCDFGALVRTGTNRTPEDERDLSRIGFDLELFEALAHGYLTGIGASASADELAALPLAGVTLTLEDAVRFLTDHLQGDTYFRIHREAHNLDRARAQLRLAACMWEARDVTRRALEALAPRVARLV